jgi:hypothetical protein
MSIESQSTGTRMGKLRTRKARNWEKTPNWKQVAGTTKMENGSNTKTPGDQKSTMGETGDEVTSGEPRTYLAKPGNKKTTSDCDSSNMDTHTIMEAWRPKRSFITRA